MSATAIRTKYHRKKLSFSGNGGASCITGACGTLTTGFLIGAFSTLGTKALQAFFLYLPKNTRLCIDGFLQLTRLTTTLQTFRVRFTLVRGGQNPPAKTEFPSNTNTSKNNAKKRLIMPPPSKLLLGTR
ncbi:MAG: hypothetical protein Q8P29_01415 [Candidatus Levybacteria bacterium]|nr:hypothetical protein [Candidatus Levybacteria bacterium]